MTGGVLSPVEFLVVCALGLAPTGGHTLSALAFSCGVRPWRLGWSLGGGFRVRKVKISFSCGGGFLVVAAFGAHAPRGSQLAGFKLGAASVVVRTLSSASSPLAVGRLIHYLWGSGARRVATDTGSTVALPADGV